MYGFQKTEFFWKIASFYSALVIFRKIFGLVTVGSESNLPKVTNLKRNYETVQNRFKIIF